MRGYWPLRHPIPYIVPLKIPPALKIGAFLIAAPIGLVVSASRIYLGWVDSLDLFVFPWDQWLTLFPVWGASPWMKIYIIGSAAPAALIILIIILGGKRPGYRRLRTLKRQPDGNLQPTQRGVTKNHGDADWMEMDRAMKLFPGPSAYHGGVVVAEAYRVDLDPAVSHLDFDPDDPTTWGMGGTAPLLVDPCTRNAGHCILFGPSGAYKTVSAVTTLCQHHGASVILDVKGELGPMLSDTMERDHCKAVHFLNPKRPEDAERWGLDALDWIKPGNHTLEEDIYTAISWVFEGGKMQEDDKFFVPWAKDLCACLLADRICDPEPIAPPTLLTLRRGITLPEPEIRDLLRGIYHNSDSMFAREIAGSLMDQVDRQFSGIVGTAARATAWIGIPSLGDLVSGNAFKTDDIIRGDISVFVQIPIDTLDHSPGVARVIIGSLLKAILRAEGRTFGKVLFYLDEVAKLKYMHVIENARDLMRASGVVLYLVYQAMAQLKEQWGPDGLEKWCATTSWRGYTSVRSLETAKMLVEELGQYGTLATSEGHNFGTQGKLFALFNNARSEGSNENTHEQSRQLAMVHELLQEFRQDEVIIVGTGHRPIRASLPIYFRRPELVAKVKPSPLYKAQTKGGNGGHRASPKEGARVSA